MQTVLLITGGQVGLAEMEASLNDLVKSAAAGDDGVSFFVTQFSAAKVAGFHSFMAKMLRQGLPIQIKLETKTLEFKLEFSAAMKSTVRGFLNDAYSKTPDLFKAMKGPEVSLSEPDFDKKVPDVSTLYIFKYKE